MDDDLIEGNQQDFLVCNDPACRTVVSKKRAKYYFKLSLKKQFVHFITFPNGRDALNYP